MARSKRKAAHRTLDTELLATLAPYVKGDPLAKLGLRGAEGKIRMGEAKGYHGYYADTYQPALHPVAHTIAQKALRPHPQARRDSLYIMPQEQGWGGRNVIETLLHEGRHRGMDKLRQRGMQPFGLREEEAIIRLSDYMRGSPSRKQRAMEHIDKLLKSRKDLQKKELGKLLREAEEIAERY